jgi:hypothetical protein
MTGWLTLRSSIGPEILIPDITERRTATGYAGCAILFFDSCPCHTTQGGAPDFNRNAILVFPIPPHSSHQVQPLDLGIFGVFKLFFKNRFSVTTSERRSAEVMRIQNAWQRATIPRNVAPAFRSAGLVPFECGEGWYLKFSKEEAIKVRY